MYLFSVRVRVRVKVRVRAWARVRVRARLGSEFWPQILAPNFGPRLG